MSETPPGGGHPMADPLVAGLFAGDTMAQMYMVAMTVAIARLQDDPRAWARALIADLEARLDGHTAALRRGMPDGFYHPAMHDLMRQQIEALERDVLADLAEDGTPPRSNRGSR